MDVLDEAVKIININFNPWVYISLIFCVITWEVNVKPFCCPRKCDGWKALSNSLSCWTSHLLYGTPVLIDNNLYTMLLGIGYLADILKVNEMNLSLQESNWQLSKEN